MYISCNQSKEGVVFENLLKISETVTSSMSTSAHIIITELKFCNSELLKLAQRQKQPKIYSHIISNVEKLINAIINNNGKTEVRIDELRKSIRTVALSLTTLVYWIEQNKNKFSQDAEKHARYFFNTCLVFKRLNKKIRKTIAIDRYMNFTTLPLESNKFQSSNNVRVESSEWNFAETREHRFYLKQLEIITKIKTRKPKENDLSLVESEPETRKLEENDLSLVEAELETSSLSSKEGPSSLSRFASHKRKCQICLETKPEFKFYFNIVCSHSFCKSCTIEVRKSSESCSVCREPISLNKYIELVGTPLQFKAAVILPTHTLTIIDDFSDVLNFNQHGYDDYASYDILRTIERMTN